MRPQKKLLLFILIFFVCQGCNTLYNFRFVNIEVVEPGNFYFPERYSTAAIVYNNANIAFKQGDARYAVDNQIYFDNINNDSIAADDYFSSFVFNLKNQVYFDSIIILEPANNSNTIFSDSLLKLENDSLTNERIRTGSINEASVLLANLLTNIPVDSKSNAEIKFIDPQFGLYSATDIERISDSTQADILISLDFYKMADTRRYFRFIDDKYYGFVDYYSFGLWNYYDLKNRKPLYYYTHSDTTNWETSAFYEDELAYSLPTRKDALYTGATISGENFVSILVPHWKEVERLFYITGQVDIKPAEILVNEGKWEEAALIWEKHINNPNKKIAAKCLFNLAIASEMEGNFDDAINLIVQSYHILGSENIVHAENCTDYIQILGKRKQDVLILEKQFNPNMSNQSVL